RSWVRVRSRSRKAGATRALAKRRIMMRVQTHGIEMTENRKLRMELANRLFFRLYQCANMLHKTGTRAIEEEGLTTQQWAVLGALSRPQAQAGMKLGDLARYLMVSRQNLSGVIGRLERDGRVATAPDPQDRRSRLITMTPGGREVWQRRALPKIHEYYDDVLQDFSTNDTINAVHYLLKMLNRMQQLDTQSPDAAEEDD